MSRRFPDFSVVSSVVASTLSEQLFKLKNEDAIKKSENLRDTYPCEVLSISTKLGLIQSHKTVPLKLQEEFLI
jgi:hypothetical protein